MSGGRLVVLDRLGRDVKAYPLSEGLATIGSGAACDIRVLLPTVSPHHATVVVHPNQTVVSSITAGETLVNGVGVSVCVLRHGDRLGVGGRTLRWEYDQPHTVAARPALPGSPGSSARKRARGRRRSPLAPQRGSVPASSAKQVAIVQPQRRHTTNDQNESPQTSSSASSNRSRSSRNSDAPEDVDTTNRKSTARASPKNVSLSDTTKASLWIESRKTPRSVPRALPRALPRSAPRAARKSTPLRLAVLRKAQSAHKLRVTKIQAPSKIEQRIDVIFGMGIVEDLESDIGYFLSQKIKEFLGNYKKLMRTKSTELLYNINHTKQAAIMLMTGHTPKPKPTPKRPSFVVKKPSPVRGKTLGGNVPGVTPKRASPRAAARGSEGTGDKSVSDLQSPILPKPRKSALKKSSKKSTRKTESIKFDLSNLDNPEDRPSDVVLLEDVTKDREDDFVSEEDLSLHYSDFSRSPSPKRSIQSRSSRILERSIGESLSSHRSANLDSPRSKKSSNQSVLDSPRQRKSSRGSLIVEKALESSIEISPASPSSRRSTKSMTDQSYSTTFASTRKTLTCSPRSNNQNLESYSIVDLVSMDSIGSDRSVYGSAGSETSTTFATPRPGRSTRANNSSLLSSSTPYADKTKQSPKTVSPVSLRSRTTSPQVSIKSKNSTLSKRRSASLTTPENTQTRLTINSTRISRVSRSRSRINDSDILLMDDDEASPKSSRRISKSSLASPIPRKTITITDTPESAHNGTSTPENKHSPEEATTPVLSIQNFLEQSSLSQSSLSSQRSQRRRGANFKRKTIGGDRPEKPRSSFKSRSLVTTSRRSLRPTKSSVDYMDLSLNVSNDLSREEEVTTPKSAVLPIPEGVKNKHSTAKKTQSKRSIIDNLDESDFVKQLFNSPVKRKLSQSMTEFSRKKLFEDDDDVRRPTRNTIALTGRTPDNSFMERTENFTPDVFVSPMSTPGKSPNITGLERQFDNTPESNRRNVRGDNNSLLTRRSIKNDLTDVAGVKRVFGRSPRNRLSDVRVKEVFAPSPKNDLRRVTGVKTLFLSARKQKSPKNTLENVRGVKELFRNKKSVSNDLRNVSGVKSALRVNSPRNDLSDVRGLRRLYRESPKNNLSDVSGVEELFNVSQDSQDSSFDDLIGSTHENQDLNTTFDQLLGKPTLRAYTNPRSFTKVVKPKQKRNAKSLNDSISMITENVEEWLQNELKKRVNKDKSTNKSNLTRELQKLTTDTVEGSAPIIMSRSRNSTMTRSVNAENQERKKSASETYNIHTLPIKKRSIVEANKPSQLEVLPLKKRRVVHSTPVKGRVSVTMNASELGRVSPIANVTAVGKIDGLLHRELSKMTRTKITLTDDLSFEMATTKVLVPEMAQKKPSPKRVSPKKPSQKQVRASTRSNRRGSLVITKKKPILSPKSNMPKPKTPTNDGNIEVMPTRNRPVRQIKVDDKLKMKNNTIAKRATATETENQVLQSETESEEKKVEKITKGKSINKEPPKTPKNTRARAIKMTVVVTKPSPQLKPNRNLNSKVNDPKVTKSEARTRQRKQDIENIPDLTIEQKQSRRTRNAKNVTDAKPTKEKPKAKTVKQNITKVQDVKSEPNKRGKHVTFEVEPPTEAATKRVRASKSVITEDIKVDSTRRRNVKDIIETATFIPKTRKRQGKIAVTEKNTELSIEEVGIKTRRGAKSKNVTFKEDIPPNKRGKSVQSQNDSKLTRSKKSAENTVKTGKNIVKDTVQAGNKSTDPVITDKEEGPKRGNKKAEEKTEIESARRTTRKAQSENTIGVQNVQEDNKEKAVGRRTRKATISKSEEIVKEDKNNIPENKKEVVAGKKTRNLQKSNAKGKGDEKVVLEDKMEVETSSRGRRNKNVTQEVPLENAKGKKTTAPEKEATKRGGRTKKAELEVPPVKEVQPEETKPARRKRKVDVDETTIREAPAKRLRTTRAAAAALVEPVVASGRSRRR